MNFMKIAEVYLVKYVSNPIPSPEVVGIKHPTSETGISSNSPQKEPTLPPSDRVLK